MQQIIVEKPYRFIAPHRGTWWSSFIQTFNLHGWYLRRYEGIVAHEIRGLDRLQASLAAGHGILLTPNHCRYADPLVLGWVAKAAHCHLYAMASWHLFHQSRFITWAIHKMGGFSVNREGVDRQAINTAVQILESAERPLVIFPEGAVSRTNDRLLALLDGIAFIARSAAKRRAKNVAGGKVVVHPIAIKYLFQGDIEQQVDEVLTEIEARLTWRPQRELSLLQRIGKVGRGLLCLKEVEYFNETRQGDIGERLNQFINHLLYPLEQRWLGERKNGAIVPRVKALRMRILPEMIRNEVTPQERQERWRHLADLYLAQQLYGYPPDYLVALPTVDRILETIERFEEDLTDKVRVHGSLKVVMQVGEALEVTPERDRTAAVDPLMGQIERGLQSMLDVLARESKIYHDHGSPWLRHSTVA